MFPLAPNPILIGDDGQISLSVSVKSDAGSTVTVVEEEVVEPQPDTVSVYVVVESGVAVGFGQFEQDKPVVGDQAYVAPATPSTPITVEEPGHNGSGVARAARDPADGTFNNTVSSKKQLVIGSVTFRTIVKSVPPNNRDGIGLVSDQYCFAMAHWTDSTGN